MSLIPAAYIEKSWRKAMNSLEYGTLDDAPILQDFLSAARASRAG